MLDIVVIVADKYSARPHVQQKKNADQMPICEGEG